MDALRREGRGNDREQVGAVDGHVRRAVELLAQRIERRPLQGAPVLPAALVGPERAHALAVEPLGETEAAQHAGRIGRHVDPAADLGQLGRLLVNADIEPGLQQRHRGSQPADAAADHRYLEQIYARPHSRFEAIAAPSAMARSFLNEMSGSSLP